MNPKQEMMSRSGRKSSRGHILQCVSNKAAEIVGFQSIHDGGLAGTPFLVVRGRGQRVTPIIGAIINEISAAARGVPRSCPPSGQHRAK